MFRPSLYTAAMLQVLESQHQTAPAGCVLDVGVGSGLFLAALGTLGASELWGVDINPDAIQAASELLEFCTPHIPRHLFVGDLWAPLPRTKRFDVIAANLPHFPGSVALEGRHVSWSGGDGRALMTRFLRGLPERLKETGAAYVTHHDLVGLEESADVMKSLGLSHTALWHASVFEPPQRMQAVSEVLIARNGHSIKTYGGYTFVDARILKITFNS